MYIDRYQYDRHQYMLIDINTFIIRQVILSTLNGSIIYSQTLRLKRLYSLEKDFKEKLSEMKSWFLKRRCPEQIIDYEMVKVNFRENKKKSGINK